MGQHQIVLKLEALLGKSLTEETQVVYFMIEARKLIEHHEKDDTFPAFPLMQFYSDWVCHTKLDRWGNKPEVLALLKTMDDAIEDEGVDEPCLRLSEFVGMDHLVCELGDFLEYFKLPLGIVTDGTRWRDFALALSSVLHDQPLEVAKPDIAIVEFRITRVKENVVYGGVRLRDGRTSETDVAILTAKL